MRLEQVCSVAMFCPSCSQHPKPGTSSAWHDTKPAGAVIGWKSSGWSSWSPGLGWRERIFKHFECNLRRLIAGRIGEVYRAHILSLCPALDMLDATSDFQIPDDCSLRGRLSDCSGGHTSRRCQETSRVFRRPRISYWEIGQCDIRTMWKPKFSEACFVKLCNKVLFMFCLIQLLMLYCNSSEQSWWHPVIPMPQQKLRVHICIVLGPEKGKSNQSTWKRDVCFVMQFAGMLKRPQRFGEPLQVNVPSSSERWDWDWLIGYKPLLECSNILVLCHSAVGVKDWRWLNDIT